MYLITSYPNCHVLPQMKEVLIYKLYFVLLNSEKLAEILFLYVLFIFCKCSRTLGCLLECSKLEVGKAARWFMSKRGSWSHLPPGFWGQFTSAWLTLIFHSMFALPASLAGSSIPSPRRVPKDEESLYLFYLLEMAERVNYFWDAISFQQL